MKIGRLGAGFVSRGVGVGFGRVGVGFGIVGDSFNSPTHKINDY